MDQHDKAEKGAWMCKLRFVQWGVNANALLWWNCTSYASKKRQHQKIKETARKQQGYVNRAQNDRTCCSAWRRLQVRQFLESIVRWLWERHLVQKKQRTRSEFRAELGCHLHQYRVFQEDEPTASTLDRSHETPRLGAAPLASKIPRSPI